MTCQLMEMEAQRKMLQRVEPLRTNRRQTIDLVLRDRKSRDPILSQLAEAFFLEGPEKPKRARTGYILFVKMSTQESHTDHNSLRRDGGKTFESIGTYTGEVYRNLPESVKQLYDCEASRDKMRYINEMRHYNQKYLDFKANRLQKTDIPVPNRKPCSNRAISGFNLFTKEERVLFF